MRDFIGVFRPNN